MDEKKPVEMVRLPRQEQYFDREDVFGRDVTSVFPNQGKQEAEEAAKTVAAALGAKKFISETELEDIKKTRGGTVEDGVVAADRSLAEQLAENKAKKEAEFQEVWRRMKEGTQRPLDTEEAQFLDTLLQQRAQRERAATQEDQQELEAFREALKQRTITAAASRSAAAGPSNQEDAPKPAVGPQPKPAVKPAVKPTIKPIIKPVRKGSGGSAGQASTSGRGPDGGASTQGGGRVDREDSKRGAQQEGGPDAKRRRVPNEGDAGSNGSSGGEDGSGLAGLLGGYSSDSDEG